MKDLVIVGAGGFAREVAWLVRDINSAQRTWNLLGHVDNEPTRIGQPCGDATIIGDDDWLRAYDRELSVVIGIGAPAIIDRVRLQLADNSNLRFPNLVHPSVLWDQRRVILGHGNIICAGNILTTDISIGSFNILNLASTFGHDARIGSCCVVNPGVNLSGRTSIGDCCLLGTGAVILEGITIADHVTVGGGAVVTKDVEPGLTVVGVPARPLVRQEA